MAARFCLVARGRRGEEHCAETGERGPGRDHGRVRPPRLHWIERTYRAEKKSLYRGLLYSAQNLVKKDPGRAKQKSLATAGTNFTKPGAQN